MAFLLLVIYSVRGILMSLDKQVELNSRHVQTQSYSMSVSELVSMYKDGELELHPEFQRFFRWTPEQKSRLVESLVLGIPVPPIFVSERLDSKWDVIDGLQRLSTILEVLGELKDERGEVRPKLRLVRTHYLPDLEGKSWDGDGDVLSDSVRIRFKRARLDVNIIRSASDQEVKYEVFQRLNTGATSATDQEVRNCLLVMANSDYFRWVRELSDSESFRDTLAMSDRALEEAFDMELVSRYLILTRNEPSELQRIDELGAYLNRESLSQARDDAFPKDLVAESFHRTFEFLSGTLRDNAFRRYDAGRGRYVGPMLVSLFEVVAVGLGYHLQSGGNLPDPNDFELRHRRLWGELGGKPFVGSGVRASTRIPGTIQFGREWVRGENKV